MDEALLNKIKIIIQNHLDDENFGVTELASELGLNNSQLLRKVKSLTSKPANNLIRKIRLNEALRLIKEGGYTAGEIAYKVGFSSPSYFCKCFHDHFGYTPGECKIKNDSSFVENETDLKSVKLLRTKIQRNLFLSVLILAIVAISYLLFDKFNTKKEMNRDPSIAVLPFKNISSKKENQYLADGVLGSVHYNLNNIKGLKVISETTMKKYGESMKTAPEIAKELNVSYLLEASVQQYEDKVRIIVKLIDGKNDEQIWSDVYDRNLTSIFDIQTEISKKVASELKASLSDLEIKRIEYKPTENLEAYKFYLLGRFLWNKRTFKDYEKSIFYYEKAVQEDPEYGLAYAGLADTYNLMALQGPYEGRKNWRDKAVEFALIALEFDKNLAVAHNVLASIYTYYDWSWEEAEKEYLIALKIDSNDPTVHQYYSEYLSLVGRHQEAREHINKALELDPLSFVINFRSTRTYLFQGSFDEALKGFRITQELNKDHYWMIEINFFTNYWLGDERGTLIATKKIGEVTGKFESADADSVYQISGLNGLIRLRIENINGKGISKNYLKAEYYSLLGENEKAIDLLEQLFETKSLSPEFTYNINFKNLHSNDRFMKLYKKTGLPPS
jgi:TolB-like protein/AraC-like DNA-binding protein